MTTPNPPMDSPNLSNSTGLDSPEEANLCNGVSD